MRYIKIKAKTYNEAMMKLKMEHGEDAIPISHKYIKEGGLFNTALLAKEVVELTAAVQERKTAGRPSVERKRFDVTVGDAERPSRQDAQIVARPLDLGAASDEVSVASISRTIDSFNENLNSFKSASVKTERQPAAAEPVKQPVQADAGQEQLGGGAIRKIEQEFEEIKRAINRLASDQVKEHQPGRTACEEEAQMKPVMDVLKNNDFEPEECSNLMSEMKNSISKEDLKDRYKIEKTLKDLLKSRVVTTGPIKTGNKKKIIMFIGPTGVGKTTTMAKLGAIYSLREGYRVAFITIDNYRIAATEQLKKYAEIMTIPIYSVNNQKEFKDVISDDKAEIIMVDTSGRSHRNDLKISEIKSFAEQVEYDFEKILCVAATTKKSDLNDVFKAFDTMHFNSVVITKVDETSFIGNVVDIADKYHKPISYFTNGQEVPNDIIIADPDKIVDMMIGNITF